MAHTPADEPFEATVDDAAEVARLLDAFNREFDTPTPGPVVLTARVRRLLNRGHVVACLVGGPPQGVAVVTLRDNVWSDGPVGLLDELYVAPPCRGQGIGTRLLRAAELSARRRGEELLEINVDSGDTDARRFYERLGYAMTGADQPEPALYYYRDISEISSGHRPVQ